MKVFTGKIIVTLLLLMLNAGILFGQVLVGPKVGGRMNWMVFEDFDNEAYTKSPAFGFVAGFTAAYKVEKRYLIQLDIAYSRSRKSVKGIEDPILDNKGDYHFLNTPILYKVDFLNSIGNKSFKWYAGFGPNVSFWLGGDGKLSSIELLEENIESLDYKIFFDKRPADPEFGGLYYNDVNRLQFGLIGSLGLVLEPSAGQSFIIDLRYEWGHSYMSNANGIFTNTIAYQDNLKARIQAIQLSVSYVFDLVGKGKKEKKIYYEN